MIEGSPNFLGGASLFHKNLARYLQLNHKNISISWIYFGKENKKYKKEGIEYIELKSPFFSTPFLISKSIIVSKFLKKNYFDILNTPWGIWINFHKKIKKQRIIQTFHGTAYYFNKNHFKRFNLFGKILILPLLIASYFVDRPNKKTDKLICVSDKVKEQVQSLYGKKNNMEVIRTGVDLKEFNLRNKAQTKKNLKLDPSKNYGLYIGGGGFWTKGLDRAINLGKEIHKIDNNFRLLIIGPDYQKVKHLLNHSFIIFLKNVPREKIPSYYSASDFFFCLSRYEGGAPTLVVSESMASGCLLVCSKDSKQEIVKDKENSIIIENFGKKDAKKILDIYRNKNLREKIIKNSIKSIKKISLEKWAKKYFQVLTNSKIKKI